MSRFDVKIPAWLILMVASVGWLLDKLAPLRHGPCHESFAFLIPLIIAAVGAGASLLKSRAAGKSVQEQQNLYSEWMQNRTNGINDIIEKLTAGGYNPFGPQTSTSSSSSLSTAIQNMLSQTSQRPVVTPQYQGIEGKLRSLVAGKLAAPTALPPGYAASQARNINETFAGATQAAKNAAAREGLSGEAVFGMNAPIESARAGKLADMLATLPLQEREMRNQDIGQAADLTRAFGLGSDSTTKSSGTTTTRGSTSGSYSTPPNLSSLLGMLLPPMPAGLAYPNPYGTGSAIGQAGGDLAGILAWLFQQGAFSKSSPNYQG